MYEEPSCTGYRGELRNLRIVHRARNEQFRALTERNARLAGAIARPEILQAHDESIPRVAGDCIELIGLSDHDSFEGRAVGRIDASRKRFTLAARGSEGVGRERSTHGR